jgi:hypothetical protein
MNSFNRLVSFVVWIVIGCTLPLRAQWVKVKDGSYTCLISTKDYLIAGGQTFYRSSDDGTTWEESGYDANVLNFAQGGPFVFATTGLLRRSSDQGATWWQVGKTNIYFDGPIAARDSIVFASSGAFVYRSTDYGITWPDTACLRIDANASELQSLSLYATGAEVYVGYHLYGGSPYTYRSSDWGKTWARDYLSYGEGGALCFTSIGDYLLSAGSRRIWRQKVGGDWSVCDIGTQGSGLFEAAITRNNVVFVAGASPGAAFESSVTSEGVWVSADSGTTWRPIASGVRGAWALAVHDSFLFAVASSGIYRLKLAPYEQGNFYISGHSFREQTVPVQAAAYTQIFNLSQRDTVTIDSMWFDDTTHFRPNPDASKSWLWVSQKKDAIKIAPLDSVKIGVAFVTDEQRATNAVLCAHSPTFEDSTLADRGIRFTYITGRAREQSSVDKRIDQHGVTVTFANHKLNVVSEVGGVQLEILNMLGTPIITRRLNPVESIDVRDVPAGAYLYRARAGASIVMGKIQVF